MHASLSDPAPVADIANKSWLNWSWQEREADILTSLT